MGNSGGKMGNFGAERPILVAKWAILGQKGQFWWQNEQFWGRKADFGGGKMGIKKQFSTKAVLLAGGCVGDPLRGRQRHPGGVAPPRPPRPPHFPRCRPHPCLVLRPPLRPPRDAGDRQELPGGSRGPARNGGGCPALPRRLPVPLTGATGRDDPLHPPVPQHRQHHRHGGGGRRLRPGQIWAAAPRGRRGTGARQHRPPRQGLDGLGGPQAVRTDVVDHRDDSGPSLHPGGAGGRPSPSGAGPGTSGGDAQRAPAVGHVQQPRGPGPGAQRGREPPVECNAKLDPTQTSFLKMADGGGQPQLTQPAKLTEAFKYFVQGMGYVAAAAMTRLSRSRTSSLCSEAERGRSRTLSRGEAGGAPPRPLRPPGDPPNPPPGPPNPPGTPQPLPRPLRPPKPPPGPPTPLGPPQPLPCPLRPPGDPQPPPGTPQPPWEPPTPPRPPQFLPDPPPRDPPNTLSMTLPPPPRTPQPRPPTP
ncbi:uncharacterized protein LOC142049201 isoform X2 [Phalacrocorax aristotelis]|uniref:uncharacterized protein LOC142049201 isoform X2 n=1 Tax=Phalacrocorax aristotelis TaxID=126867 RepID=UPI003F4BB150